MRLRFPSHNNRRALPGTARLLYAVAALFMFGQLVFAPNGLADAPSQTDHDAIVNDWVNWVGDNGGCLQGGDATTSSVRGLPADVAKRIQEMRPVYEKAANATHVPWQLLAAIHYRENNNDPSGDLQAGNPIGGPYRQQSSDYNAYGHGYPKSMEESAEMAAEHLIRSQGSGVVKGKVTDPNPSPELIKDLLFSYNGRAAQYAQQAADLGFSASRQPYEGSPYVMNNYDAIHHNMKIITRDNGPLDGIDTRYGAFVIYEKLGGTVGGGGGEGCSNEAVNGSAVLTALRYAWRTGHPSPFTKRTPAYQQAIDNAMAKGEFVGGGVNPGIDCGGFITRVMQDSGADPNYNPAKGPVTAQKAYLDSHPDKYENLGTRTSTGGPDPLQPGDIAIMSSHTFMYVGNQEKNNFHGNIAEASYGGTGGPWWAPMAHNVYFSLNGESFTWYRLKQ